MNELIFTWTGNLAMLGWAALVFLPMFDVVVKVIARLVIPLLIAVVYAWLMASNISSAPPGGGFGSLAAVQQLFSADALLLAGWIHYLAFDLFVGTWEVEDARKRGVHHLLVVPCLAATLMAGPVGLALYLFVRTGVQMLTADQPEVARP